MRFREAGLGRPIKALVLRVDLADPAVQAGLLYPGRIAGVRTVSAMARSAGAFAAVNGDFFNIGETGAPVGPMVSHRRLIKAPQRRRALAAGVGADGLGRISTVKLRGYVDLPSGRVRLVDLNDANPGYAPMLAPNGIGLFTPAWGIYTTAGAVRGLRPVVQVLVVDGRVVHITHRATGARIPSGGYVLLGAGSAAGGWLGCELASLCRSPTLSRRLRRRRSHSRWAGKTGCCAQASCDAACRSRPAQNGPQLASLMAAGRCGWW